MKKLLFWLLIVVLSVSMIATFALAGCKTEEAAAVEEEEEAAAVEEVKEEAEEIAIRFVIKTWSKDQTDNYELLIEKFEADNPNIKIDLVIIPWGQEYEKFTSMIISGDIPNVAESVDSEVGLFDELNIMLPLTDDQISELKGMGLDQSAFDVSTYVDGKIYNFSWLSWMYNIIYRKDLFQEAGISVPKTTDELLEAAQKLTNPSEGTYGFSWRGAGGLSTMMPIILTYIGQASWFDKDGNCLLDTPEGIAALQWYYDLYKTASPPESTTWGYAELIEAFWAGSTAMYANTTETVPPSIKKLGEDNIGVFKYPAGPSGKRFNLFSYLGYTRFKSGDTAKDEAGWKFLKYLLSEESLASWSGMSYAVPNAKAMDKIFEDELYKPFKEEYALIDVTPAFYPYFLPEWQGFEFRSTSDIEAMVIGEKTPAEIAKKWADEFTPAMKNFMENNTGFNPVTQKME